VFETALHLLIGLQTATLLTVSWWAVVAALEGLLGNCAAFSVATSAL
jgi:hypothetical protein